MNRKIKIPGCALWNEGEYSGGDFSGDEFSEGENSEGLIKFPYALNLIALRVQNAPNLVTLNRIYEEQNNSPLLASSSKRLAPVLPSRR